MNTNFHIIVGGAILAAVTPLAASAAATLADRHLVDGCEVGGGGNNIQALESGYDRERDELVVSLRLCGKADRGATYRLFLDNAAPFVGQAAAKAECVDPADAVVARGPRGHHGPGRSELLGNKVRFTVPLDALGVGPAGQGVPAITLWATSRKGDVVDRAPGRETGDGCAQPRALTETLVQPRNVIDNLIWIGRTPFLGTIEGRFREEANRTCAQEAHGAGLTGLFAAWFSALGTSGIANTTRPTLGPFSTADGRLVARDVADLVDCTKGPGGHDCLRATVNLDIHGNRVQVLTWTGANQSGGTILAPTCEGWTSSSGSDTGDGGHVDRVDARWVVGNIGPCSQIRYLICFQLIK